MKLQDSVALPSLVRGFSSQHIAGMGVSVWEWGLGDRHALAEALGSALLFQGLLVSEQLLTVSFG